MLTISAFQQAQASDASVVDADAPATIVRKGCTLTTTVERVHNGDLVVVEPGEMVPVAGEIAAGQTVVAEGDPLRGLVSKAKRVGDSVTAGAVNQAATIRVRATKG